MSKPKAVVIDLDNTLALIGDRDPYAGHICATDTLCEATACMIWALRMADYKLVYLTGRNENGRSATRQWLFRHGVPVGDLIMRDPSDWRPSDVYKLAMLDERILPRYDALFALDDDPRVVAAFRARGLVCWHSREYVPHPEKTGDQE